MFEGAYNNLFSPIQTQRNVAKIESADVAELFTAAYSTQYMTDNARYVPDMELDLRELAKRGRDTQGEYNELYDAFVGSRMFSKARALRKLHPSSAIAPVPEISDESSDGGRGPTVLSLSSDGKVLSRRDFDLDASPRIVVVVSPLCHFAQHSLRDIETEHAIGGLFLSHATWLVPPDDAGTPIADVVQWNRRHPRETMELAYSYSEWPMFDRWQLPTFYFFKNAKLVSEVVGWPGKGRKAEIVAAMRRVGL